MEDVGKESEDHVGLKEMQGTDSLKWLSKKVFEQTARKLKKKPSRARLHLDLEQVVSSLKGQSTKDNVLRQDSLASAPKIKMIRKRIPTKMTNEEVKRFYNFVLNKRGGIRKLKPKLKNQDGGMDGTADQSLEASCRTTVSSAECTSTELPMSRVTAGSQLPAPVLLNVDPQGSPIQLPLMTPQLLPLTGGTQPALVFFLGPSSVVPSGDSPLVSHANSNAPLGNAVFFTQPVTLNVVPQDASSSEGVIEKAMELAQFQSNPVQSDSQQPSQDITTELVISEGSSSIPSNTNNSNLQGSFPIDHAFGSLPNISQNVVIAQSVAAGESVPIENVSESVTVKTSQIMQNQGLFDLRSILDEARAELADSADTSTETVAGNFADAAPKLLYRKKGLRIREVMTQTGGESEVYIVSERKLDSEEDAPGEGPLEIGNTDNDTKKPARVKQFECDKCEKKFYTNNLLRRHQTSHQEARPFSCEECQKGFRTSSELTIHKAIHVEVKQYKCEFCGKEFRTKGCIKSHIKYHIGDKRHKCTECGRAFVKSADLKRHMAGHRNEKKFVCDDCGSAFTRRDNLKAHRLLHTRESVVTCDLCSKEFINAVYLKRHMHIHKQAKKKPYECQWCPKTYEQLEGLRRHIRQHVGDEKFVCKDCGKKFITSIQLKRHLWLSHDQDSPYRRSIL